MFKKKKKCALCPNKLTENPFRVILEGTDNSMLICDECARLMEVISDIMETSMNDESL